MSTYLLLDEDKMNVLEKKSIPYNKNSYEIKLIDTFSVDDIAQFNDELRKYLDNCIIEMYEDATFVDDEFFSIKIDFFNKRNNFKIYKILVEQMNKFNKYEKIKKINGVEYIKRVNNDLIIATNSLNFIFDFNTLEYKYCAYPEHEIWNDGYWITVNLENEKKCIENLILYRDNFLKKFDF